MANKPDIIGPLVRGLIGITAKILGFSKPLTEDQLRSRITKLEKELEDLKKQEWETVKNGKEE